VFERRWGRGRRIIGHGGIWREHLGQLDGVWWRKQQLVFQLVQLVQLGRRGTRWLFLLRRL
jgi:hypothetical protein